MSDLSQIIKTLKEGMQSIARSSAVKKSHVLPINPVTNQHFQGINGLILSNSGFKDPRFLNENQGRRFGLVLDEKQKENGVKLAVWQTKDKDGRKLENPSLLIRTFYNIDQFENSINFKNDTFELIKKKPKLDESSFDQLMNSLVGSVNVDSYKENAGDKYRSYLIMDYSQAIVNNLNRELPPSTENKRIIDTLAKEMSSKLHSVLGEDKVIDDQYRSEYFSNTMPKSGGAFSFPSDEDTFRFYSKQFSIIDKEIQKVNQIKDSVKLQTTQIENNYLNMIKDHILTEGLEKDLIVDAQRYSDNTLAIVLMNPSQNKAWGIDVKNETAETFYHFENANDLTVVDEVKLKTPLIDKIEGITEEIKKSKERIYFDVSEPKNEFKENISKAKELGARWDKDKKSWFVIGTNADEFNKKWTEYKLERETLNSQQDQEEKPVNNTRIYFEIPYVNRNQGKELGARWDKDNQLWYSNNQNENLNDLKAIFKVVTPEQLVLRQETIKNKLAVKDETPKETQQVKLTNEQEQILDDLAKIDFSNAPIMSDEELESYASLDFDNRVYVMVDEETKVEAFREGLQFEPNTESWFTDRLTDEHLEAMNSNHWNAISESNFDDLKSETETLVSQKKSEMLSGEANETDVKDKIYIDVDYADRVEARKLGAKWDSDMSLWFIDNPDNTEIITKYGVIDEERLNVAEEKFNSRVYLNVAIEEKDEAKALGARWDKPRAMWYSFPDNKNIDTLQEKWGLNQKESELVNNPLETDYIPIEADEKIFIDVSYHKKDEARSLGAKWDKEKEFWFTTKSNPNIKDIEYKFNTVSLEEVNNIFEQKRADRTYLNVPIEEKDEAKKLGARWDRNKALWYVSKGHENINELNERWGNDKDNKDSLSFEEKVDRTYLNVPYDDIQIAKDNGCNYDPNVKRWYWNENKGDLPDSMMVYLKPLETTQTISNPIDRFKEFLEREEGFEFNAGEMLIPDGKVHRCPTISDTGDKKSAYYILHDNGGGMFLGIYENYKKGAGKEHWYSGKPENNEYSEAELLDVKNKIEEQRKEIIAEMKAKEKIMAERARMSIDEMLEKPNQQTPYLFNKEVDLFEGVYTVKEEYANQSIKAFSSKGTEYDFIFQKDDLIIPLINSKGEVVSLQNIKPNGDKYLLGGAQKKGAFHIVDGDKNDLMKSEVIFVAEGYATGASIAEIANELDIKTNTVIALDAGNLKPVVENLKKIMPNTPIIITADNDYKNELKDPPQPNIGIEKANEASKDFADVSVMFPEFRTQVEGMDLSKMLSDFNDQATQVEKGKSLILQKMKGNIDKLQRVKNLTQENKNELKTEYNNSDDSEKDKKKKAKGFGMKM